MSFESLRYGGITTSIPWSVVEVSGGDCRDFLQRQTTSDIAALRLNEGQISALLDGGGRIISLFFLFRCEKHFFVIVEEALKKSTIERLEQFIIMEDVVIRELPDTSFMVSTGVKAESEGPYIYLEGEKFLFEKKADSEENTQSGWSLLKSYWALQGLNANFEDSIGELINSTSFMRLAVSLSKGCYLGQETVSKIDSRRGAGKSHVLIRSKKPLENGPLIFQKKKIGTVLRRIASDGDLYLASLTREFRVEGKKLEDENYTFEVLLFPFFKKSDPAEKAQELYDRALINYTKEDEVNSSLEDLKIAISLNPSFADAYESIGVIYGQQEQYEEALSWLHKLLEVDQDSVMAHTNLSLFYMKQGKIEEAEKHKDLATVKSFASFGREASREKELEEVAKQKKEDLQRREKMFLEVLSIDSEDAMANCGLGEIHLEREEFAKAREYLEKTLESDKKYSVAYLHLAKTLIKLCEEQEAKEVLERGIIISAQQGDMMPANEMQHLLNTL